MTNPTPSSELIERIQKLMRLSESKNENEAAVATSMATKLMQAYNLEKADVEGYEPLGDNPLEHDLVFFDRQAGYNMQHDWVTNLGDIIAQANFCKASFGGRTVHFWGRGREVAVCKYMMTSLYNRILELGNQRTAEYAYDYQMEYHVSAYRERGSDNPLSYRNSWLLGASVVVRDRVWKESEAFKQSSTKANALVLVRDEEVEKFQLEERGGKKIPTIGDKSIRFNSSAYLMGKEDGKGITTPDKTLPAPKKAKTLKLNSGK